MSIHSGFARLSVVVTVAAFGVPASSLQITGLSVVLGATNTANELVNSGTSLAQIASSTSIVLAPGGPVADTPGSNTSFLARYASMLTVDREALTSSTARNMTSLWQITFTVANPTGGDYRIDIDTSRLGALTNVDESILGNSTQTIGAVTGRVDGVVDASLALATVGPFTTGATGVTAIDQTSTTLSILDSAVSRTFVLDFTWTSSVSSAQDEAAIRLGLAGALSGATADDYPGQGGRAAANDGHFVDVTATYLALPVPEPEPLVLVTLGLLGLASASRRARIAGARAR